MEKLDFIIEILTRFIIGLSVLILSVVTSLQVVARFIFNSPIAWGQDIIRLSFIYLVFYGGAYCVIKNEHLNIDILLTSLDEKKAKYINIFIEITLIFFFIFLIYYGFIFTKTGLYQKAPYLPIPMSLYYFSLPTASIVMIYFEARKIMTLINGGKK
ncbi:MAG: TRAP transporter small permease [Fusobacterium gastrosuis]|uniref:TRAP transporter small permease n=1 Tax=Fusobacterium gastrosuis TaxID=1755100 RepID=UPI002A84CD32|nr:TRAP transporter small permease [Fusobacterium gastrosuis]